ncbi:unnamed protein product [Dimorphilus gyrociliatus]|uniref:RING-type domain-containing protein n=1 Tax=Dimorphilus gyrociliatus TaxID=2664684 RepID=A0A7I8VU63_9ANNE|nr:unnamed protein product [Dimorphilus gyrociliatus]
MGDKEIECSICSSRWFSMDVVALPCSHVCCSECFKELEENYKDNLRIDCPSCQVMMTFPKDDSSFPYYFNETDSNISYDIVVEVPNVSEIIISDLNEKLPDNKDRQRRKFNNNGASENLNTMAVEGNKHGLLKLEKTIFLPLNVTYVVDMAIGNNRLYLLSFIGSIFEQSEVISSYSLDGKFNGDIFNVSRFLKGSVADSLSIYKTKPIVCLCCSRLNTIYTGDLNNLGSTLSPWLDIESPTKLCITVKGLIITFKETTSIGLYDESANCFWKLNLGIKLLSACAPYDGDYIFVIDERQKLILRNIIDGQVKVIFGSQLKNCSYNVAPLRNGIAVAEQQSHCLKFYNSKGMFDKTLIDLGYRPEKVTSSEENSKNIIYLSTTVSRVTRLSIYRET